MSEIDNEQRIAELEAQLLLLKDALASQQAEAEANRKFDFGKVKDAIDDSAKSVMEFVRPVIDKYEEPGRAAVEKVSTKVSDNPFLSVTVAFGAGIVIGTVLNYCCKCGRDEE